jgi:Protein of unknown function (DUF418)
VILQSFALFFLVGVCFVRAPKWLLATLASACLVVGPLVLTVFRRDGLPYFDSKAGVAFEGLSAPDTFVRGLLLQHYPALIWLGFFFVGMLLGRANLSSAALGRRLFGWATVAAVVLFTVGWAGARAFGPPPTWFEIGPPPPMSWSEHWTTYGFSNAIGWTLSSTALSLAIVGASIWLFARARRMVRVLTPIVALGAMSLTFYLLHFLYLDTLWEDIEPNLTTKLTFFLASVAFWLVFALLAQLWLRYFARGPFEAVLYVAALVLTWPLRHYGRARSSARRDVQPALVALDQE